jgi:hypothetical protein
MEKDIGKINKNENTDIVIRIDDFGGVRGITIREFTSSERYTGFTKSGTRIPAGKFKEFKELVNSIPESDLEQEPEKEEKESANKEEKGKEEKTNADEKIEEEFL